MSISRITRVADDLAREMFPAMGDADRRNFARRMLWWFRHHFEGQRLNIGKREPFALNIEAQQRVLEMTQAGEPLRETARECGMSHEQARKIVKNAA